MKNRRILVSGAGIAGLTLAYWLRRHGLLPTVVERAPGPRDGGYKIDVRGPAVDVVERMGVLAQVEQASIHMRTASWVNGSGALLATVSADFFEARDARNIEITRDDLKGILYELTRADVEYLFDDSISRMSETDGGVRVEFGRGEPRVFDLVVGADGVRSNVRALGFGDESRFVHDLGGYYVATFSVPNRLALALSDLFYVLPGRTMNVSSLREDADARAVFVFTSRPLEYDRRDVERQKNLVAEMFADVGWEVPRWLSAMRSAADFYLDTVSQIRMDRWSQGRTVLVGDAAYAPSLASGQGTSLALVGAYVLAGELEAACGDHGVAFGRYEKRMRRFVEDNQKLGEKGIRAMVLRTRWQIGLMIWLLRWLPRMPCSGWISRRLKEAVRRAANAIELEDHSAGG